jgi:Family of unknown function (DUF6084)
VNEAAATAPPSEPAEPGLPAPRFEILDSEAVRHAAAPSLAFTGHVTETSGREVYTIALTAQIMIEPAKRSYDEATRERLVEMFGPPERWATTTHPFLWAELNALVPAFTGATAFRVPMACTYDLELAAAKYIHSMPGGEVPLLFNFSGTIFYRGDAGRMQIVKVPWDCSARYSMPAGTWQDMIAHHYPNGGWVRLDDSTLEALGVRKAERGLPSFDATVADLLEERRL